MIFAFPYFLWSKRNKYAFFPSAFADSASQITKRDSPLLREFGLGKRFLAIVLFDSKYTKQTVRLASTNGVNHNTDSPTGHADANNPNWGWRSWCPFWFLFGQAKRNINIPRNVNCVANGATDDRISTLSPIRLGETEKSKGEPQFE